MQEEVIFEQEGHYYIGRYHVPVFIKYGETARQAMQREREERNSENRLEFDKSKEPWMEEIKTQFEMENRKRVISWAAEKAHKKKDLK